MRIESWTPDAFFDDFAEVELRRGVDDLPTDGEVDQLVDRILQDELDSTFRD